MPNEFIGGENAYVELRCPDKLETGGKFGGAAPIRRH